MKNFDYNYYLNRYKDLRHLNREQALKHLKTHGSKERRKFNKLLENFDYNYYIKRYNDLRHMNYIEACNHYIDNGIREKRQCKKYNNVLYSENIDYNDYNDNIKKYDNCNTIFYCCSTIYKTANRYSLILKPKNYQDKNTMIMFGLYKERDILFLYNNIKYNNYKNYIIIFGGSDTWSKRKYSRDIFLKLKEYNYINNNKIKYYSISNYINQDLLRNNINFIPFNLTINDTNMFKYTDNTIQDKIYVYDIPNGNNDVYNVSLINKIIMHFGTNLFIKASETRVEYDKVVNLYNKCFLCLRLTKHDGNANNVQEFGLLGIKCIHNSHYYNSIPFNENNLLDIINTIDEIIKNVFNYKNKEKKITSKICEKNNLYCNLNNLFDKNIYPEVSVVLCTFNDNKYNLINSLKSVLFQHMIKTTVYVISYVGDTSKKYIDEYYSNYDNLKYITLDNDNNNIDNNLVKICLKYIKTQYFCIINCNTVCYSYKYYIELKNIINTDNDFIISNNDYIKNDNIIQSLTIYNYSNFLFDKKILNKINKIDEIYDYNKMKNFKYCKINQSTILNLVNN